MGVGKLHGAARREEAWNLLNWGDLPRVNCLDNNTFSPFNVDWLFNNWELNTNNFCTLPSILLKDRLSCTVASNFSGVLKLCIHQCVLLLICTIIRSFITAYHPVSSLEPSNMLKRQLCFSHRSVLSNYVLLQLTRLVRKKKKLIML